ncbi:hypothetical protein ACU4GR_11285 [Methylobacterium oryzae CBMB20]
MLPAAGAPAATAPNPAATAPAASDFDALTLATAAAFAFLGGLILNLMPCVFPVLSIKVLSLVRHAGEAPARACGSTVSPTRPASWRASSALAAAADRPQETAGPRSAGGSSCNRPPWSRDSPTCCSRWA